MVDQQEAPIVADDVLAEDRAYLESHGRDGAPTAKQVQPSPLIAPEAVPVAANGGLPDGVLPPAPADPTTMPILHRLGCITDESDIIPSDIAAHLERYMSRPSVIHDATAGLNMDGQPSVRGARGETTANDASGSGRATPAATATVVEKATVRVVDQTGLPLWFKISPTRPLGRLMKSYIKLKVGL
jgi:hypothetical protein